MSRIPGYKGIDKFWTSMLAKDKTLPIKKLRTMRNDCPCYVCIFIFTCAEHSGSTRSHLGLLFELQKFWDGGTVRRRDITGRFKSLPVRFPVVQRLRLLAEPQG